MDTQPVGEGTSINQIIGIHTIRSMDERIFQPPEEVMRVLRGGAFDFDRARVRCACRHWLIRATGFNVGFRVVSPGL